MKFQDVKETFPNALGPTTTLPLPNQIDIQSKEPTKEFARKKILQAFFKFTLRIVIDPHPPLFFSSPREQTRTLPAPLRMEQKP